MKRIIILLSLIFISTVGISQTKYFQQQVNYKINTELFPAENKIVSFETISYTNNSPDTLNYIYFHLWPNAYKNKKTAMSRQQAKNGNGKMHFHAKDIGGYIDSIDFTSKGKQLKWEYDKKHIDICKVILNTPLLPGKTVEISTPFVVYIPDDISRMGAKDSAYQITQWYPKPAVYDKYGWHQFPYLDQGEFYSEFGNFDVSITVPKQQVVGATGNLQNKEELKWLKELAKINSRGFELNNPTQGKTKTLRYTEKNIHDFAWFCSEKYYVDYDSVQTPRTKKWVTTWALYKDENKLEWSKATDYVGAGVKYYSQWVGDYPFNNCTAVDGALSAGGGMEYPAITVISSKKIETVIVHEVGHNWFYGVLGFNEREHPFLDEGFNTHSDHRYSYEVKNESPFGINIGNVNKRGATQLTYLIPAYIGMDMPLNLHSVDYGRTTYGTIVYEKAAEAVEYLRRYLGVKTYDSIMHAFFIEWGNKHPYPQDMHEFFKKSTDKDVDWFFNGFANTTGKVDYQLKYRKNNLIIKNKGDFAGPINVVSYDKDDNAIDTIWYDPIDTKLVIHAPKDKYSYFKIDPDFYTLDFNKYNNYAKTSGIFKKYEKIKVGFTTSIMDYYNAKTMIIPMPFYNKTGGFQIVGVITNMKLPMKNFNYLIIPQYSFGYKKLEGSAYFSYRKQGFNGFPATITSFYIDRYSFLDGTNNFIPTPFRKMKFEIEFDLQNTDNSDKFKKKLDFAVYVIQKNAFYYSADIPENYASIINLNYSITKDSKLRPFSFKINADIYGDKYKLWAETKYKIHYFSLKDGLEMRFFTGSNVSLTGTYGVSDFKYDHFYWSRFNEFSTSSTSFIPHQFVFQPPLFETGIMLDIIPGIFAIYMPLYGSQTLMDYNNAINDKWYSHFRFTFKIENYQSFKNLL